MGIFSFVTDAGGKLGGAVYDMLHDDEDLSEPVTISKERMDELRKKNIEDNLQRELGRASANVAVQVDGEKVTLQGEMEEQSNCEKAVLVAGNQMGIGSVDCQVAVAKQQQESTFYTVQAGDTLSKIAAHFYQSANKYPLVFEANKPMLTDPDKIYPGQVLRIPNLTA